MTTINWTNATETVDAAQTLLLVTHLNPDGDAIGSLLGLGNALRERGKTPLLAVDGGVPGFLRFLPGSDTVVGDLTVGEWDVMISLDSSDEPRSGKVGEFGRAHSKTVINVDHHPTNTRFGQVHVVMPEAVSTTEIVFRWLGEMSQPVTLAAAIPLLTGLVTDTNGFRTSNVRSSTLEIAQRLMEAGASLTEVTARTLGSKPYQTIQLWKYVLPSVELDAGVIQATIRREDCVKVNSDDPSSGGLVEFLLTANEAMVSAVFKELEDGRVELSFRCKPGYDVATLALSLGGGGHKQASGATIAGNVEQAKLRVLPLLRQVVAQGTLTIV
ncbi:MAG: bifunctional oligoribonuclease/PAP phosphatase NrnA [Anaerolinea sp.]|nr:bifunctional oligoribonuclease/PAP phosphatase NrnA [Anaerolinea sp.]